METDVNAQTQTRDVETQSEPKVEINEVVLGTKKVLNLVFEDTDFDYASVISNSMKALGFENDFDVLSYNIFSDLLLKRPKDYLSERVFSVLGQVNQSTKKLQI